MNDDLIMRAAEFSRIHHGGQLRQKSKDPYYVHPARVAGRVACLHGSTPEMVAAAFLHDILEDTNVPVAEIEAHFGPKVAELVVWLTKPSIPFKGKLNRARREQMDLEYYMKAPIEAKLIKMLDRLDNLADMSGFDRGFKVRYGQESRDLAAVIGDADPDLRAAILRAVERLTGDE